MEMKILFLTLSISLIELSFFGVDANAAAVASPSNRRPLFSPVRDANRSYGRRRSISLANLPGPPGRMVPNDNGAMERVLQNELCVAKDIVQNVSKDGCESIEPIKNRMCYGSCATIHMPGVPGAQELEMCNQCKPSKKQTIPVKMKCPGGSVRTINVTTVQECRCQSCAPSKC